MKHFVLSLLFVTVAPFAAFAGQNSDLAAAPERVVELFTSQGCSSCPPANNFVAKLSGDPDTLVLSYGVTYWDYLGWKDTFGKSEFTARQRAYGRALGTSTVYTPQIILNGSAHSARYTKKEVERAVLAPPSLKAKLAPMESVSGSSLVFTLEEHSQPSDIRVLVVGYKPGVQKVNVKRGENRGRTLTLANVVTEIMPLDADTVRVGQSVMTGMMPDEGQHYVALVHDARTAEIITAARYIPAG